MRISHIVAVAENGVIGKDNQLVWQLPKDMRFFRQSTLGHHVIMGRKNFDSMGRPLPGRTNIVITRNPDYRAEGATVVPSIEAALDEARKAGETEAFIIGGGEIYRQTMDLADCLYVTYVYGNPEGDTFYPPVDRSIWKAVRWLEYPRDDRHKFAFTICTFKKITDI